MNAHDKEAAERERFEKWAFDGWYSGVSLTREPSGAYLHPGVQNDWTVWQARAALSSPAEAGGKAQPLREQYADRYEFLRSRSLDTIDKGGVFAGMTPDNVVLNGEHLDKEIDNARAIEARGRK